MKWLCVITLPELLTRSCDLRRRKAAAIELFKAREAGSGHSKIVPDGKTGYLAK